MPGAIADGGVAHRVLGDIDAPELGVQRLGQGGAVIALAASGVQQAGPGRQMGLQQGQGRVPDGSVKPGVQKPLAGRDLGRGIPRMPGVLLLHWQEVYITLPRDVEAVPVRAAPGGRAGRKRLPAQGADGVWHGLVAPFRRGSLLGPGLPRAAAGRWLLYRRAGGVSNGWARAASEFAAGAAAKTVAVDTTTAVVVIPLDAAAGLGAVEEGIVLVGELEAALGDVMIGLGSGAGRLHLAAPDQADDEGDDEGDEEGNGQVREGEVEAAVVCTA